MLRSREANARATSPSRTLLAGSPSAQHSSWRTIGRQRDRGRDFGLRMKGVVSEMRAFRAEETLADVFKMPVPTVKQVTAGGVREPGPI
jgi:hypothetical protein